MRSSLRGDPRVHPLSSPGTALPFPVTQTVASFRFVILQKYISQDFICCFWSYCAELCCMSSSSHACPSSCSWPVSGWRRLPPGLSSCLSSLACWCSCSWPALRLRAVCLCPRSSLRICYFSPSSSSFPSLLCLLLLPFPPPPPPPCCLCFFLDFPFRSIVFLPFDGLGMA